MQFYDVIESRTSIKSFKSTPINKEKVEKMINAAMMCPSWKNEASFKFILVEDKQKKDSIADAIENKTDAAAQAVREAPMVVVVVADPKESGVVDNKEYYLVDGAIAMEHFILAATVEGYGTCWVAAIDEHKVKSTLQVPANYRVVGVTPVGEAEETKAHYPKKNINDYVFSNTWKQPYVEREKVMY
ncbi:nitroreductase family protein [Clostridium sp. DJ247]|uniref:nitroreductase family protein n=1 Tax=Clostridium sp. DJ247 TaxID=2726188 RepID=UPI001626D0CE|nr:nitroreductase family protein [Clostridium sp. DJ247]MBC2581180.1 nitroreductase [Clostridium sp. DJ247]